MKFYILASGSKGNSTLVTHKGTTILIDFGISQTRIIRSLQKCGINFNDIDAIFLTHDHSDHIKGLNNKISIPIYGGNMRCVCDNYTTIKSGDCIKFSCLTIKAFQLSHDASDPLGYVISDGNSILSIITDTGFISREHYQLLSNSTYYIIEANHDDYMLCKTHRPECLKQRIMSEFGHLSNYDCGLYLGELIGSKTKEVFLAHLSEEANTPELALKTVRNYLKKKIDNFKDIKFCCASQNAIVEGGKK